MLFCSGSNAKESSTSSSSSSTTSSNNTSHCGGGGGGGVEDVFNDPSSRRRTMHHQHLNRNNNQNSNWTKKKRNSTTDIVLKEETSFNNSGCMLNGGYFVKSLSCDVWYLIFTYMSTQWFFLNGRLVCKEWFNLIHKRGVYSPKLTYYISNKDQKKELQRCEKFVNLCREGYFKQILNLTIHSDCLLENGGLLRLLFGVSNNYSKEQRIMKGCNTKHVDHEEEIYSTAKSPRDIEINEIFSLNKLCKSCEKTLLKQTSWINLLKTNSPAQNCFPKLTSLSLCYEYPVAKSIITSPFISSLTELNLGSGHVVNDDDIKEIVNTPQLSNLKSFSLYHNLVTEVGAFEIANSLHMSNLTSLELGLNRIGTSGFLQIINSPILNNLTYLDVNRNELKFDSVMEINKRESNLKTLILLKNDLGLNGSISFLRHARFPHLTHLNISANNLGSEGIKNIAKCSYLNNLTILEAGYNNVGDEGVRSICNSPYLVNLKQLDLINNRIGPSGANFISNTIPNLTHLDLSNFGNENINHIGNEGAFSIASSPNMINMKKLFLRRNNIGEEASKAMENSEFLTSLLLLDLRYNDVDVKRNKTLGGGTRRTSDDFTCILA